jgi:DNA-binding transcriptional LysR family regulator
MVQLRQLRYFVAVAEERNFSRAAARLHVSQPPLSVQIKSLERELGASLFMRDNRGATLTAAGAALYDEARAVLARVDRLRVIVGDVGRGDTGTLAIGFVSLADYGALPPALKAFRARYPRVDVQLHEMTTDAQVRELAAGRLDVGIALGPVQEPGLAFDSLSRESLVVALPSGHALARGGAARLEARQLAGESFIVPPRPLAPGLHDLVMSICRSGGFEPRVTQEARQMQTVISLVAGGMGVALVPESLRQLKRAGVVYRPLRGRLGRLDIGTLRAVRNESPLVKNFLRTLRESA